MHSNPLAFVLLEFQGPIGPQLLLLQRAGSREAALRSTSAGGFRPLTTYSLYSTIPYILISHIENRGADKVTAGKRGGQTKSEHIFSRWNASALCTEKQTVRKDDNREKPNRFLLQILKDILIFERSMHSKYFDTGL